MKKQFNDMIITFKLFEAISIDGLKPAYLMNLPEYNEKVSPILKEFSKWIKKNLQYYIVWNYSFVNYITWEDFKEKELDSFRRNKFSLGVDYIQERWKKTNGIEPDENIPESISKQFKEYRDFFIHVFGEKNLSHIEPDEMKSNKRSIRRAIQDNTYLDLLRSGEITGEKLTEICDSVGVKVPTGVLKKANVKPTSKKEAEKTTEEIQKIYANILRGLLDFKSRKQVAGSLVTRMTRNTYGISYSTVSTFKYMVDKWKYLTDEQKSTIEREYPDYSYKIKQLASKDEEKREAENISFDKVLGPIIQKFKEGIQPMVDEQKDKINKKMRSNFSNVLEDYETLTGSDFEKRYGSKYKVTDAYGKSTGEEKYTLRKFWESLNGRLIKMKNAEEREQTLVREILNAQNEYQTNEHVKIEALFGRLRRKYTDLIDFELDSPKRGINGIEYFMKAYDKNDVIYNIITETIYAGGYNIQRLHLRWLMSVYCNGERISIFKSGDE